MELTSITLCSSGSWLTGKASIAMIRGTKCRRLPSLPIRSATSCTKCTICDNSDCCGCCFATLESDQVPLERSQSAIRKVLSGRYGRFERYACCADQNTVNLHIGSISMTAAIAIGVSEMAWPRFEVRLLGKCHSSVCFHKPRRIVSPGCFHDLDLSRSLLRWLARAWRA